MTKRRFKNCKPVGANLSLGNSLVNCIEEKRKTFNRSRKDSDGHQFQNLDNAIEAKAVDSRTHESAMDEFMATAELAGREFNADKNHVRVLSAAEKASVVTKKSFNITDAQRAELESNLPIPRRPYKLKWESTEELVKAENNAFLEWRGKLAAIQEKATVMLTPFERNLELWRQLWRVVERSDIVVQIVDARNPLLFRSVDLERYVEEVDPRKRNVILINKADLLTKDQVEEWRKYFVDNGIIAVFWSALIAAQKLEEARRQQEEVEAALKAAQLRGSSDEEEEEDELENKAVPEGSTSEAVAETVAEEIIPEEIPFIHDAHELLTYLKGHVNLDFVNRSVTIGMVGYPNVGKSSTINSILGGKKVSVSATPGKTKHFQTFIIDETMTLCDCPGLTMPSYALNAGEMLINGILPSNQMQDHFEAGVMIASRVPRRVFEIIYSILLPKTVDFETDEGYTNGIDLLTTAAFAKGYMSTSGVPDYSRACRMIIKNVVDGVISWVKAPPNGSQKDFDTSSFKAILSRECKGNAFVLQQISKRNLLEGTSGKLNAIDKNFFNPNVGAAHTMGVYMPKAGANNKICLKKPKKDKLRRTYVHLDA
uniref:CP-type G domain-containing protein n=1 Tax=Rhabditophanes sp. KR3021 TaxID=114890 RepID=A0AC35UC66_9BILA